MLVRVQGRWTVAAIVISTRANGGSEHGYRRDQRSPDQALEMLGETEKVPEVYRKK